MAFAERLNRDAMSPATSERLARVLRIERYHETVIERVLEASALAETDQADAVAAAPLAEFRRDAEALLQACAAPDASEASLSEALDAMERRYEGLKSALLAAGAAGRWRLQPMEESLRRWSALRRAAQQATKAARLSLAGPSAPAALRPDDAGTG